ncbi:hypothetical protein K7W42_12945 [Deinococcus sp. HMF7604]|uniref:hypothetical protein n=1 Tax=Deinococcus betulae TaxID=2873312 RepID=UPI001CCCCED3|nr:hypothetical protein [Deinococcus betulae]
MLPPVTEAWPVPRGHKWRPGRWREDEAAFRAFFTAVVATHGPDALAQIWHDSPRAPGAGHTRWFAPQLPMHVTGEREGPWHAYLVPAAAALLALDRGLIICRAARRV